MIQVNFRIQSKEQRDIPIFPEFAADLSPVDGEIAGIGLMQAGMASGRPAVGFCIRHEGKIIYVATSAAVFLTLAAGIKGAMERWGEKWEGA